MPKVDFQRKEYEDSLPDWTLIRDCLKGERTIKAALTDYLPMPNAADQSAENVARYRAYVARAVFYNVARRTLEGLVGQVFAADPAVSGVADDMQVMLDDASGSGVSADQISKRLLRYNLGYGRGGLLLDFPDTDTVITRAQMLSGEMHPNLIHYDAFAIINWRTKKIGSEIVPSLVVLQETYDKDDGFEIKALPQIRVLRLDEAGYVVDLYKKTSEGESGEYVFDKTFTPKDSAGKRIARIPFWFVGSIDNDSSMDEAPLYDLCSLNIAHYRNSADYEDSCYLVGQPTPWVAGLTQAWVDKNMNGVLQLGSRGVIPLPQGGTCGLLQAGENPMPMAAMEHKERQMVALGAKLVEQQQVQRTLGEAKIEAATETSVLSSCASNVSLAMTNALRAAATLFYGVAEVKDVFYTLSTDFAITKMTPEERKQLVTEWQAGAISFSEMRDQFRSSGIATLDDDAAQEEIANDPGLNLTEETTVETITE